jgi:hypothetical protein
MANLVRLCLCLLLVLTGQQLALARGAGAGQMAVLCAADGLVTVTIDPVTGAPTGPAHYCPDGLTLVLDRGPVPGWVAPVRMTRTRHAARCLARARRHMTRPLPPARGPPACS